MMKIPVVKRKGEKSRKGHSKFESSDDLNSVGFYRLWCSAQLLTRALEPFRFTVSSFRATPSRPLPS